MSTTTDKDYIDAKMLAATNQMIGDIKAANAASDGRLAMIEARIDGRIASIESSMRASFAEYGATQSKNNADVLKWMVGTGLVVIGVTIGGITFVINNIAPKAPAVAPAPIVIYALPAPAAKP